MPRCPRSGQGTLVQRELKSLMPCPIGGACQDRTDEQIINQIKKNKECFVYLLDRYQEKIKRYVIKISGVSSESAEDLVQEIFVKVYANLDKFDTNKKFSSWLYRIARNETINYWLYSKRRQRENWDIANAPQIIIKDSNNIEKEIFQKINNEKMIGTFENISEKYRQVLVMNYLEGKSYREIAEDLEKPVATIGTLLNRGKRLLKEELIKIGFTAQTAFR